MMVPQPRNPATPAGNPFNAINRGVYIADNLDFLRAINTASVDLVCIDPPFAKNDTFTGDKLKPPLRPDERDNEFRLLKEWGIATQAQADAAGVAWPDDPKAKGGYRDTWAWDEDVHEDWITGIETTHPAVSKLLDATRYIHGEDTAAYLCFMAIRLIEIHRILKATGSLYLHCDHSANSYLRQLLDGVFGRDNLRREIIWTLPRPSGFKTQAANWIRRHDTIFYYTKGGSAPFNKQYEPYPEDYLKHFNKEDERGKYWLRDGRKRRMGAGFVLGDVWMDIHSMQTQSVSAKEGTGYPTQKPIALAERIIKASTNPGDVVLDCFAGCAYTAMAAERIRQSDPEQARIWTACDINPRAWTVFKRQFNKPELVLLTCNDQTTGQQVLGSEPTITVHGPAELPRRTTAAGGEIKPLRTDNRRQYKRESTLLNKGEMLTALLQFSNGKAWCCGFSSANADGSLAYGDYELDHIVPKSKGGEDDIVNRAPLCSTHNQLKSDHNINLQELRTLVAERREFKAGITSMALPKLAEAYEYALRVKQAAYQRKYGKPLGI